MHKPFPLLWEGMDSSHISIDIFTLFLPAQSNSNILKILSLTLISLTLQYLAWQVLERGREREKLGARFPFLFLVPATEATLTLYTLRVTYILLCLMPDNFTHQRETLGLKGLKNYLP